VLTPVTTCNLQDQPLSDQNAQSVCDGGQSAMCTKDGPLVINDTLAIGTAAVALSGTTEAQTCCACYQLTFTSTAAAGKTMVVQSINTGGDVVRRHFVPSLTWLTALSGRFAIRLGYPWWCAGSLCSTTELTLLQAASASSTAAPSNGGLPPTGGVPVTAASRRPPNAQPYLPPSKPAAPSASASSAYVV
jgi:hypothetical protein